MAARPILGVAVGIGLLFPAAATAAPGDVDPIFSGEGFAFASTEHAAAEAPGEPAALAVQPDGRIVVGVKSEIAGLAYSSTSVRSLMRFEPDGTIDESFGQGGHLVLDRTSADDDEPMDLAVQSSGRILVTLRSNPGTQALGFRLVGITPSGELDRSFGGGDGSAYVEIADHCCVQADRVEVMADDRIVVAGVTGSYSDLPLPAIVARLTPDGAFDPSFSENGWMSTDPVAFDGSGLSGLELRPDGSAVLVGSLGSDDAGAYALAAAQISPEGALDARFGGDGAVALPINSDAGSASVALDSRGRLAVGVLWRCSRDVDRIVRVLESGELDPSFGVGGVAGLDLRSYVPNQCPAGPQELALDPQDRVLLVGPSLGASLFRLDESGALDPSFGRRGLQAVFPRRGRLLNTADLLVEGDTALAAFSARGAGGELALARFELGDDGLFDVDADGIADSVERCWQVFGGCPRRPFRITAYADRGRGIEGGLRISNLCVQGGLRVRIMRSRPGRDSAVASTRTDQACDYRVSLRGKAGTFYAAAKGRRFPFARVTGDRSRRHAFGR